VRFIERIRVSLNLFFSLTLHSVFAAWYLFVAENDNARINISCEYNVDTKRNAHTAAKCRADNY